MNFHLTRMTGDVVVFFVFFVFNVQVVGLVMLVALLDCGQSQDGLRFPNLFGGLTNFFRQATQQQPQPQQRPVNSQVSPGSGVGTTFPFLQAPPPAFQQPPQQQQQQQQQAPVFFQNTGKNKKITQRAKSKRHFICSSKGKGFL